MQMLAFILPLLKINQDQPNEERIKATPGMGAFLERG